MTAMIVDELGRIPMSPFLLTTLKRAAEYADAQAHLEVSLEHLLLALTDDPEATVVLKSSGIDLDRLAADVSAHLGGIGARQDPAARRPVVISADLRRILEAAAAAAQQGRRREINGAIVLAAIVGDSRSAAAHVLRAQGLTFEEAIRALQRAASQPPPSQPQTEPEPPRVPDVGAPGAPLRRPSTDDLLAEAREKVQTRTAPPTKTAPPAISESEPGQDSTGVGPTGAPSHFPAEPSWQPAELPRAKPAPPASPPPRAPVTSDAAVLAGPGPRPAPRPAQRQTSDSAVLASPGGTRIQQHWAPPAQPAPPPPPPRAQRAPPPLPPSAGMAQPGAMSPPPIPGGPTGYRPSTEAPAPWPEAAPSARARRAGRPDGADGLIERGQLVENIPRRMRVARPVPVEVRIARDNVKGLADSLQGGGSAYGHGLMVTRAMSVRLRAPDGGFWIETASPETQWIDNVLDMASGDYASWRWTITPREKGRRRLQLVISARTAGGDGVTAETALPDQVIEVRVATNYAHTAKRSAGWIAAALAGGLFARFGEQAFEAGSALVTRLISG